MLHSHSHHDQTRLLLAEIVLWWVHVDILLVQDSAFQMPLPQLLQCRRRCLHQFLHNLAHSKVYTELVTALVVVVASADAVDAVDVVDEADLGDGVDALRCCGSNISLLAQGAEQGRARGGGGERTGK